MTDPVLELIEDARRLAAQVREGEVREMPPERRLAWDAEAAAVLALAANELRARAAALNPVALNPPCPRRAPGGAVRPCMPPSPPPCSPPPSPLGA